MPQPSIAVIGAGFSGTLLSLALQSTAPAGTRIHLIEGAGRFALGSAYATSNVNHLLNVPAGRMSAFPDRPLDFVRWLEHQPKMRLNAPVPNETTFVARSLYGAYLQHLLELGLSRNRACHLELVDDQVADIGVSPDGLTLLMASGAAISADLAVLAIGLPRSAPFHREIAVLEAAGLWRRDPWAPSVCATLDPAAPVLLVGCGLTMVDTVISLLDVGHVGPIHAVSRHGLLPQRHAARPLGSVALPPLPKGLLQIVRCIRNVAAHAMDWRAVIDALRPIIPELWHGLSQREKRQFIRHLRVWWDIHRHRMAPQIADRIEGAQASGQLRVRAGRIVGMAVDNGLASVAICGPGGGDRQTLTAARVIDCTGHGCDISRNTTPLLRKLFRSGLARPDRINLGLDVSDEGALVSTAGIASARLFAVGALTRGSAWELTAVPELRRQCLFTARVLGKRLAGPFARNPTTDDIALQLLRSREKQPS